MQRAEQFYIIGREGQWLKSSRPDIIAIPYSHIFSGYRYDAKRFRKWQDVKKTAKKFCGDIFTFIPATGETARVATYRIPEKARCGNCKTYTGFDGCCKQRMSERYMDCVLTDERCDSWEERVWTRRTD